MSIENCHSCGAAISTLATKCQACGAAIPSRATQRFGVPRYLFAVPLAITLLTGTVAIATVSGSVIEYRSNKAAVRLREERAAAAEQERIRAEQLQTSLARRDSILRAVPTNRIRRARAADLIAGLAIVSAIPNDSIGRGWVLLAEKELARRARADSVAKARPKRRTSRLPNERGLSRSTAPSGASAQCRDGTYSFSSSRRGTCSRHGGVAIWF
jgi:hypothetical protein